MNSSGNSGFKTKIGRMEGFTLIEVIVSIAILSIVSVVIVQMFTVSAKSNNKAYIMDKANALCTETAEHFKADPGFPGADRSGFNKAVAVSGTGTVYYRYLDRNLDYMDGPAPASGSVYRLDVTVTTDSAIATTAFNYPDAAYEYELKSEETNITLKSTGSVLPIDVNGFEIDPGKIIYRGGTSASTGDLITAGDALIPVLLYCSSAVTSEPKVNIANKVKTILNAADKKEYRAVADIYLCDVPPGINVTVKAEEGIVAQQSSPVSTVGSQNIMYTAAIKITKLSDVSVLAENNVNKYWVN